MRNVDRELQRIKRLAVVSGRQFGQEASSTSSLGPPPSPTSTVSSAPRSAVSNNNNTSAASNLLRRPVSSASLQTTRSARTGSFTREQPPQLPTRSETMSVITSKTNKTSELDKLEKDLLAMYEDIYLRVVEQNRQQHQLQQQLKPASARRPSSANYSQDERIDKWVVSVLPEQHQTNEPLPMNEEEEERIRELTARLEQAQQERVQGEQLMRETMASYVEQKEVERSKVHQLSTIVVQQEELIERLQQDLTQSQAELQQAQTATPAAIVVPEQIQEQVQALLDQVSALQSTKEGLEQMVVSLWSELELGQTQVRQTLQESEALQAECAAQRKLAEDKLETLMIQLLEKETLVQKYRQYNQQRPIPPPKDDNRRSSIPRLASSPPPDRPARSSRRSSANTTVSTASNSKRRSYIARWTGGFLPPPAPPPTDPLPPLPDNLASVSPQPSQQPPSDVQEEEQPQQDEAPVMEQNNTSSISSRPPSTSSLSSLSIHQQQPKHFSVDAVHQHRSQQYRQEASMAAAAAAAAAAGRLSEDEPFDDPEAEAAYREFAEQLQTRLSISKEIDDLRVWQPSDLVDYQQRFRNIPSDDDLAAASGKRHSLATLTSKDGAAFWRGMKKKLRV
ncbi:hypothetical protein BCR43DRAFT_506636 [Syncephalastrum racemosum]|uniref:Uncharacterized protein n=1 Tax=Syncephalastrum racemosum TaxID=13706 RepID=A0A1X2H7Y2_SYNRA|nr:hypothetical protein BCR43DRAFT_506636 [Syncephalastrum racemosum]